MNPIEVVVGLVLVAVVLAAIAQRWGVPYPTILVLGGLALGFVPGLPPVQIPPSVAFLVFIPPLVYQVATRFALRDLRTNRWPIFRLAVGLVLVNLVCVAGAVHWGTDGLSWAAAFVLAAIVSPTDTAAVAAVTRDVPVPRRVERILDGESLFNDVVALVAYQQAVRAAVTGSFSVGGAVWELVWDAAGGAAVGVLVGVLATLSRRRVHDPAVNTTVSLLTPFAAFLVADWLGASGVLATVAAGLYVGHVLLASLRPLERVQAVAFWDGTRFILEGLAFVLIGLHLRQAVAGLPAGALAGVLGTCATVCAVTLGTRLVWVLAWNGLPRVIGPRSARPPFAHAVLLAWAGVRGVDSLAAALALPLVTNDGATPFPHRDLILLVAFSVILVTIVLQGLTLPVLIRALGLAADAAGRREDLQIRLAATEAAARQIGDLARAAGATPGVADDLRALYQFRARCYRAGLGAGDGGGPVIDAAYRLMLALVQAEREAVFTMWSEGRVSDEARARIGRALDYEELKLEA